MATHHQDLIPDFAILSEKKRALLTNLLMSRIPVANATLVA